MRKNSPRLPIQPRPCKRRLELGLLSGFAVALLILGAALPLAAQADAGPWPTQTPTITPTFTPTLTSTVPPTQPIVPPTPTISFFVPTETPGGADDQAVAEFVPTNTPAPPRGGTSLFCWPLFIGLILVVIIVSTVFVSRRST